MGRLSIAFKRLECMLGYWPASRPIGKLQKYQLTCQLPMLGGKPRFNSRLQAATLTHNGFRPKFLTEQASKLVEQFLFLFPILAFGNLIVVAKLLEVLEPLLKSLSIEGFGLRGQCRLSRR